MRPSAGNLENRLAQIPGVTGVAQISLPPLTTLPNNLQNLEIQGRPVAKGLRPIIDVRYATRDYFRAMGIPVFRGRIVEERDTNLAVINTEAARRFFPGEDPIGKSCASKAARIRPVLADDRRNRRQRTPRRPRRPAPARGLPVRPA